MLSEYNRFKLARYYSSVGILYVATLLFAWFILHPYGVFGRPQRVIAYSTVVTQPSSVVDTLASQKIVTGKPVKLGIASLAIDLPVDDGIYNETDQTWTLSATHAHYALPTMPANNIRGNTLIYGHYNINVFYHLKDIQPGALAEVKTDNGHVFTYLFKDVQKLKPDDVSIFDYQSYPMLTLQTCTGSFYEFRQLFYFTLQKVDGQSV